MFMKNKGVNRDGRCQAPSREMAAWQFARKGGRVQSAENLAMLMAVGGSAGCAPADGGELLLAPGVAS